MAETRKDDQDRFIDETLSLFQNAISETKTALPPVWFGRAVEPKDVPPSEPPAQEKRAASLIGQAVSFVRTVAGFEPRAAETASPSLQPPVAKQVREKPVRDARSDPLIDQALSMVAIVSIDEPNKVVEAASPPSLGTAEVAVLSVRQSVGKPASKDGLPLERPTQEEPPSLIGHPLSSVSKVAVSEHKAILVEGVVISEPKAAETASPWLQLPAAEQAREKPVGDARSDPLVDQALSMVAIVSIDEPKVVEAASPTPTVLKTEAAIPLSQQLPMKQFSPKERLDMDRADIRRRVAIFREHQQRFQREREEYYAATMAKVRAAQCTSGTGIRDN
jgi:hypothetical protein